MLQLSSKIQICRGHKTRSIFLLRLEAKIRKNATCVKIEKNFSKTLLQCNGKLISYATIFLCLGKSETYWTYQQSFLPSSSKLILYERYFWVWVKVKHIEPINTFFSKPIQRFSEKNCKDAQEKFVCQKKTLCGCFVVLHLCFT